MKRRPAYQRPVDDFKRGRIGAWPADKPSPGSVAARVRHVWDGAHKNHPAPHGEWTPAWRSHKAKCAPYPEAQWPKILGTLRAAIASGCVDQDFRGDFPSRAWAYINGVLHEARLSNPEQGWYKGFPLECKEHYPDDPDGLLRKVPNVSIP